MTPFAARYALIAAASGVALLMAPLFAGSARAFTIEEMGGASKSDGARSLTDSNARDSRFGSGSSSSGGQSTIKQGNTTLQFGGQSSFNQRYDSNRLFDPASRLNDGR